MTRNVKNVRQRAGTTGKWAALIAVFTAVLALPLQGQQSDRPTGNDVAAGAAGQPTQQEIMQELDAMKKRIAQLEAQLQKRDGQQGPVSAVEGSEAASKGPNVPETRLASLVQPSLTQLQSGAETLPAANASTRKPKIDPFSDWDWTWLNGNPRNKDVAFDSKFFTPEIRADITYTYDFNKPIDDSMSGSSELFRSNEVQVEQLGLGGDFHYDNVRARFMTQFGIYSTTTCAMIPATPRDNGLSTRRTGTWQKPTAVITSMR